MKPTRQQQLNAHAENIKAKIGQALGPALTGTPSNATLPYRIAGWTLARALRMSLAWLQWRANHHRTPQGHTPATCPECRNRNSHLLQRLVNPSPYPTPGPGSILIPLADEVPSATATAIKAETGVDIHSSDDTNQPALALAWWYARVLPQYQGLTHAHVQEQWDTTMISVVRRGGTDTQTQDAFQSIVDALPEIDEAAPPLIHFARPRRHPVGMIDVASA